MRRPCRRSHVPGSSSSAEELGGHSGREEPRLLPHCPQQRLVSPPALDPVGWRSVRVLPGKLRLRDGCRRCRHDPGLGPWDQVPPPPRSVCPPHPHPTPTQGASPPAAGGGSTPTCVAAGTPLSPRPRPSRSPRPALPAHPPGEDWPPSKQDRIRDSQGPLPPLGTDHVHIANLPLPLPLPFPLPLPLSLPLTFPLTLT